MDETTDRLPKLRADQLDDAQRALYDAIVNGPRARGVSPFPLTDDTGALAGPFNAMLLRPALGAALQDLGGAVRYRTALTGRAREIAILLVAHSWDSAFERYAHEAVGRATGLSEADIEALRDGRTEAFDDPGERLVAGTTAALVARGDLSDEEFAAARAGLGLPTVFELTTLVGYYSTLALQLRVFRVAPPESLDTAQGGRQDPE
jgi:4-carboxymuconolactone decarboxylase